MYVYYYLQEGMCSFFWFLFVATCKYTTTLNYSNITSDFIFLFLKLKNELVGVGGGLYFVS